MRNIIQHKDNYILKSVETPCKRLNVSMERIEQLRDVYSEIGISEKMGEFLFARTWRPIRRDDLQASQSFHGNINLLNMIFRHIWGVK